ncbi:MAG: hypothetical protein A4E29_00496 [Methanomassiliicoccales archaeon PtaB.Bin134]|nr:MAG: hypothetical protein A4E29_00496 [Methanomassiliicoccales archaeon PtaB.Bin134]
MRRRMRLCSGLRNLDLTVSRKRLTSGRERDCLALQ